jgi:hypothetical protein
MAQNTDTHHVVQLGVLLVLKLIAPGLHMEIVFRGKDLELEPGPP